MSEWQSISDPRLTLRGLVVGGVTTGTLAWLTTSVIGSAWAECDILGPGDRFGLTFVYFPGIWIAAAIAFALGSSIARHRPVLVKTIAGTVCAMVVCVAAIVLSVPLYGDSFWAANPPASIANFSGTEQCGPGGIPTWWPVWLPH